jgi:hypothetical protein
MIASEVESRLREYTKLRGVDDRGKTPSEHLGELDINRTWKQALQEFLKHTNDLAHEPKPLLKWAAQDGHIYVNILDICLDESRLSATSDDQLQYPATRHACSLPNPKQTSTTAC